MIRSGRSKILYETTSTLRSLVLAVFQAIIPSIIVLIAFILVNNKSSNYAWIPLVGGIFFTLLWAMLTLAFCVYKEWCYIDQINFLVPIIFTISFIFFAAHYKLTWYEFVLGIVVIVVFGYLFAKFIVRFVTSRSQIVIDEEHKDYLDEHEIHQQEKEYLKDFIDMYHTHDEKNERQKMKKKKKRDVIE